MSRTSYPLLDIKHALEDADRNLSDVVFYVETLQREGVPDSPPDAAPLLANVQAARELLALILPPRVETAIAQEQENYDACEQYLSRD